MKIIIEHCDGGDTADLEIVTETGATYRVCVTESYGYRGGPYARRKNEPDISAIEVWRNGEQILDDKISVNSVLSES